MQDRGAQVQPPGELQHVVVLGFCSGVVPTNMMDSQGDRWKDHPSSEPEQGNHPSLELEQGLFFFFLDRVGDWQGLRDRVSRHVSRYFF